MALETASASVGLSLNGSKTQAIVLGIKNPDVTLSVDGERVVPGNSLNILGFGVDYRLDTGCYVDQLLKDLRKNLGVLRMLKYRVDKSELRDFAYGIMMGRLTTYIANCFTVRLAKEDPVNGRAAALQVVVNDLARLLADKRRKDQVEVGELLGLAGLPSVNQVIARDAITMAWTALVACRGPLFSTFNGLRPASGTRAAASGKLNSPAESNAIIVSACKLWNVYHAELVNLKNRRQLKTFVTKVVWKSIPI